MNWNVEIRVTKHAKSFPVIGECLQYTNKLQWHAKRVEKPEG